MKKILLATALGFFALGCGEKKEEKKEGFEMN
ncbi:MAG: cytochrome c, partial [Eudoraea sp.]|nr:cytochrome c [Eudoraea sp.]